MAGDAYPQLEPEWVDEVLLAGVADEVCLHLNEPVSRAELVRLVAERHRALADAGLRRGGSVALCLAPSLAFIANLLASWQIGAQASLLDHRFTAYEVDGTGRGCLGRPGFRPRRGLIPPGRAGCAQRRGPGRATARRAGPAQPAQRDHGRPRFVARPAAAGRGRPG